MKLPEYTLQTPLILFRWHLHPYLKLVNKHKLTLIGSPSGYGKTTAVQLYTKLWHVPCIWLSLEPSQLDMTQLHNALVDAAIAADDPLVENGHNLKVENAQSVPSHQALLFDQLATYAKPIWLVIDNAGLSAIHAVRDYWLRDVFALLPANVHLVLITNSDIPTLPYAELEYNKQMQVIETSNLRLTPDEVAALLADMDLDADRHTLIDELNGWIAGVLLASQPPTATTQKLLFNLANVPAEALQPFMNTDYANLSDELQIFLLQTACMDKVTPEACYTVLDLAPNFDVESWLQQTLQRTFLVSKVDGGLRYHDLFRDYLRQEYRRIAPDDYYDLNQRLGHFCEQYGAYTLAFDHYMQAQQYDAAEKLAERIAFTLYQRGDHEIIKHMHQQLTEHNRECPSLRIFRAMVAMSGQIRPDDVPRIEHELNIAYRIFDNRQDLEGKVKVQRQWAVFAMQRGRYKEAIETVTPLLNHDDDSVAADAHRIAAECYFRLQSRDHANHHITQAWLRHNKTGSNRARTDILVLKFAIAVTYGEINIDPQIMRTVNMLDAIPSPFDRALALNNLAVHYHQCGQYHLAVETIQKALALTTPSNGYAEAMLLWGLADVERDMGRFEDALRHYNDVLSLTSTTTRLFIRLRVLLNRALLYHWIKQDQQAHLDLQAVRDAINEHNSNRASYTVFDDERRMAEAMQAIIEGHETPATLWQTVRQLTQQLGHIDALQIEAMALPSRLQAGSTDDVYTYLQKAEQHIEKGFSITPLVAQISNHAPLFAFAINAKTQLKQLKQEVDKLMTYHITQETQSAIEAQGKPPIWSLRIQLLGQECFHVNGKPVYKADWQSAIGREIIIRMGLRPDNPRLLRQQLRRDYWPDATDEQFKNRLSTTLSIAKRALGGNLVEHDKDADVYYFPPEFNVVVDVLEFNKRVDEACQMAHSQPLKVDMLEKALAQYGNGIQTTIENEWIDEVKRQAEEKYLMARVHLAQCATHRRAYDEAEKHLRDALTVDIFSPAVWQEMIRLLQKTGANRKLDAVLDEIRRVYNEDLSPAEIEEMILDWLQNKSTTGRN